MDNEILLEVLTAIKQNKWLHIVKEDEVEFETIPIEIIHDSTYGRQYLFCYNKQNGLLNMVRIDMVEASDIEQIKKRKNVIEGCWCTSGVDREMTKVSIEFYFDEEKEAFILQRIQREGHQGRIQRLDQNIYSYEVEVRDPMEMIPWIRSFGERAKVIESGDFKIEERIHHDWKKAVSKYETFS